MATVWARQPAELERAVTLVRVFYVCAAFLLVDESMAWRNWAEVSALHPIWPLAWIERTGVRTGLPIVLGGALAASLWGALAPGFRPARIAVALGLLLQSALVNSLAGAIISHGLHPWFWAATLLVFLPSGGSADVSRPRARAQRYTQTFWAVQATVLLFYSLSGSIKVAGAVLQAVQGQVHAFAPEALARYAANRLLEGGDMPAYFAAGQLIIDHPAWGMAMFPFAIYLEACSFLIAFRPALHRLWAAGLIFMHLGIYFVLGIMFSWQILLVGIVLLGSPFAPNRVRAKDVIWQLPLIGDALAWLRRLRLRQSRLVGAE